MATLYKTDGDGEIHINPLHIAGAIFAIILLIGLLFGSWYTIDAGQRGIKLINGSISGISKPGLGFKLPFVESIVKFNVRTQKTGYNNVEVYSKDIQTAKMNVFVNYHIDPAKVDTIYTTIGENYEEKVVMPNILNETKEVFGRYNAVSIIGERAALNKDVVESLTKRLAPYGIIIEGVALENIAFSDAYDKSVEERMTAEVNVQKMKQTLEQEKIQAEIAKTRADGVAQATVANAEAQAKATKLAGDAEATAIRAKGDALKANQQLVALTIAQHWNGVQPRTLTIMGNTGKSSMLYQIPSGDDTEK